MGPGRLRQHQSRYVLSAGLIAVALLGGCSNAIKGEIEHQEIKPKSAFFFAQDAVLGTDGLIGLVITDVPKGCETWSAFLASSAAAASPPDKAAQWQVNFPPDFWEMNILIRVGTVATPLTAQALQGVPWNETLSGPGQVQGYFTHHLITHDLAYFDGTGDRALYEKSYISNGGILSIKEHTPGANLKGTFPTFTVDPVSGAPTGLIEIHFDADFCATADLLANAGSAAPAG